MFTLREYQVELVNKIYERLSGNVKRLVVQLSTGGGKTKIFSYLAKQAIDNNKSVLILTDRLELYKQTEKDLESTGIKVNGVSLLDQPLGLPFGDNNLATGKKDLIIAMVETLTRRMAKKSYQKCLAEIDLVIIDEAHKASFTKVFKYINPEAVVLGFTATPLRTGGMPQLGNEYEEIVEGVSAERLINLNYLIEPTYFADKKLDLAKIKMKNGDYDLSSQADGLSEAKVYDGVVANYLKHTPNTKALLFAPTLDATREVMEAIKDAKIPVRYLGSDSTPKERQDVLKWFKTTKGILCNCGILTTGFDQPDIETIIMYRATKSFVLLNQIIGRGVRTCEGKTKLTVLDFGGNIERFGLWEDKRTWSLFHRVGKPKPDKLDKPPLTKECPTCGFLSSLNAKICKNCGYSWQEAEEKVFAELLMIEKAKKEKAITDAIQMEKDRRKRELQRIAYEEAEEAMRLKHEAVMQEQALERYRQKNTSKQREYENSIGDYRKYQPAKNRKELDDEMEMMTKIDDKTTQKEACKKICKNVLTTIETKVFLAEFGYISDYSLMYQLNTYEQFVEYCKGRRLDDKFFLKFKTFVSKISNKPKNWNDFMKRHCGSDIGRFKQLRVE